MPIVEGGGKKSIRSTMRYLYEFFSHKCLPPSLPPPLPAAPSYPGSPMVAVREYAHQRPSPPPSSLVNTPRSDFTETVYWSSTALLLNDQGQATVKFTLSDSITTYAVEADLVSSGGLMGKGDGEIRASLDLSIEAKTPVLACVGGKGHCGGGGGRGPHHYLDLTPKCCRSSNGWCYL